MGWDGMGWDDEEKKVTTGKCMVCVYLYRSCSSVHIYHDTYIHVESPCTYST